MNNNQPHEKTIQTLEAKVTEITYSRDLWRTAAINSQTILQSILPASLPAYGQRQFAEGEKAIDAISSLLRAERKESRN